MNLFEVRVRKWNNNTKNKKERNRDRKLFMAEQESKRKCAKKIRPGTQLNDIYVEIKCVIISTSVPILNVVHILLDNAGIVFTAIPEEKKKEKEKKPDLPKTTNRRMYLLR